MALSEIESYSDRRFRLTVAGLAILIFILVIIGILSHRSIQDNRPVWKSSPFSEMPDTGTVKAARDSVSQVRSSEPRH
jgi:hypothetical protein